MLDLTYFPHFVRANYPNIVVSAEEAEELGVKFKEYMLEKFEGKMDKLESSDISMR